MTTRPTLSEVIDDLVAEHADLDAIVADAGEAEWDRPTPAEGWSVRDTVSHLAFFDERATESVTVPDAFRTALAAVFSDPQAFIDAGPLRGRGLPVAGGLLYGRQSLSSEHRKSKRNV